ncbi:protocatechuate 3,4-dioxygenase beta subunit [Chitinophaga skermanii]|uniref:Protocatechuate 3,4-dioxygenase beta subunit n=1 Tax=Chitinophaga skermanii TaxID=331697 RepID=A0A327QU32_9BACT|nr:intradiol ring-cleavage dioxygenase [Chitinophaga skermanii]RAJ06913.1 protocatechuate 3,4-dioxygenase beta subunit [Chitinophaga skermanii]
MERKEFLKNSVSSIIGLSTIIPVMAACKKSSDVAANGEAGSSDGSCKVTDTETDGPYPLYTSRGSSIQRVNITDGKAGIPLDINITIRNVNNSCNILGNARVDIWHCDKDGYYSGYTNQGYLGTQNNTSAVFCRGIQYTDANGVAKFTSIYPGWYQGRVTHIHAQIYVDGKLKLTTQIAFPDAINTAVYNTDLYKAHGQNSMTNSGDNIISDSLSNELATVVANASGGYDLTHTIYIAG